MRRCSEDPDEILSQVLVLRRSCEDPADVLSEVLA